jgi:hypothetical protein
MPVLPKFLSEYNEYDALLLEVTCSVLLSLAHRINLFVYLFMSHLTTLSVATFTYRSMAGWLENNKL